MHLAPISDRLISSAALCIIKGNTNRGTHVGNMWKFASSLNVRHLSSLSLFMYGVFDDKFSRSDCVASNGRTVSDESEKMWTEVAVVTYIKIY
jgi:hypothetical protein